MKDKLVCFFMLFLIGGAVNAIDVDQSAEVGYVSNYYFRGVTETNDSRAIQGSMSMVVEDHYYAGLWASNVTSGELKTDVFAGYRNTYKGVDYSVGVVRYQYNSNSDRNATEYTLEVTPFKILSLGSTMDVLTNAVVNVYMDLDNKSNYVSGSLSMDVPSHYLMGIEGVTIGETLGYLNADSDASVDSLLSVNVPFDRYTLSGSMVNRYDNEKWADPGFVTSVTANF